MFITRSVFRTLFTCHTFRISTIWILCAKSLISPFLWTISINQCLKYVQWRCRNENYMRIHFYSIGKRDIQEKSGFDLSKFHFSYREIQQNCWKFSILLIFINKLWQWITHFHIWQFICSILAGNNEQHFMETDFFELKLKRTA